MGFDSDAPAQIQRIRQNLNECDQTPAGEKSTLLATIEAEVGAGRDSVLAIRDIRKVQTAVRNAVASSEWYFKGRPRHDADRKLLYSTQSEIGLEDKFIRDLQRTRPDLSEADAMDIAQSLISNIFSDSGLTVAKSNHRSLLLHLYGQPIWLADPVSGNPNADNDITLLPARLGLNPHPTRYVLLKLHVDARFTPRFADSGAYPYWRPGGKTNPIEQCPSAYNDGFDETIGDGVTVSALVAPIIRYERTI